MDAKANADFLMQKALDAGIVDRIELANFMGQMQVESGGFRSLEENLNYSAARLLQVFPGRNGIDDTKAEQVASGGAEAIGNAIYGGPWGRDHLGNTGPGDGYNYRGRGFVQLTGRSRYEEAGAMSGLDLLGHPELAAERGNAAAIAIVYWKQFVVSHDAQRDVTRACFYINGGYKGLEARVAAAATWSHKLELGYKPGDPEPGRALRLGSHGKDVLELQERLGRLGYANGQGHPLHPDGEFGPVTKAAVEEFQHDHGLERDGVAGRLTQQKLLAAVNANYGAEAVLSGTNVQPKSRSRTDDYLAAARPAATDGAEPSPASPKLGGPGDGTAQSSVPEYLRDFRHPEHPAHVRFKRVLVEVHAMEDRAKVPHGPHSERVAASVTGALDVHDAGARPMQRLGSPARIDLCGQGAERQLVISNERVNYYLPKVTLELSLARAMARSVPEVTAEWSRRHSHLYQPASARSAEPPAANIAAEVPAQSGGSVGQKCAPVGQTTVQEVAASPTPAR